MWWVKKNKWPVLTADDIRKHTHILVIDDEDFVYQKLFQKDGYMVDKWNDVKDLTKLESGEYDIILLDIQGVGKTISPQDQGFGILKHIHKKNPAQIVVAYSTADYSLKYQDFFRMADATLDKNADYVEFKRTVEDLLASKFSAGFYVDRILRLAGPHTSNLDRLSELATKGIESGKFDRLERFVREQVQDKETVRMILQIVQVALSIITLWKK